MKTSLHLPLIALSILQSAWGDPLVDSWHTSSSGSYARLFETSADEAAGNSVTTWSRGQGIQALPTYAGVHEISFDDTRVYVRSTGLGTHVMGPWYMNEAQTNLFPNYPANRAFIYQFPRDPGTPPAEKELTGLGRIGLFVDGVDMFDSRDAFSYDTSASQDDTPMAGAAIVGDGVWNRDAYVNEGVTFDAANAHQAGASYHYHANPPALRHQLGDSVDYNASANRYTENFNGSHSPILGWVNDGYPIYGPYGYSDANDPASPVRRMISGFRKRSITQRQTLPAYAARDQNRPEALPEKLLSGHRCPMARCRPFLPKPPRGILGTIRRRPIVRALTMRSYQDGRWPRKSGRPLLHRQGSQSPAQSPSLMPRTSSLVPRP